MGKNLTVVLLLLLALCHGKVSAQQAGPTIAKAAKPHSEAPLWKIDMVKRLDAMAAEGGDSIWICSYPECQCTVFGHVFLCIGYIEFDCHRHIFQPCTRVEIIQ